LSQKICRNNPDISEKLFHKSLWNIPYCHCEGASRGNLLRVKVQKRAILFWYGHFQSTKAQKRRDLFWRRRFHQVLEQKRLDLFWGNGGWDTFF